MKELSIFYSFAILLILVYVVSYLSQYLLHKLSEEEQIPLEKDDGLPTEFKIPNKDFSKEKLVKDVKKPITPKDANDIQNLDSKYNVGTYRASNGRYKSLNA